MLRKKNCTQKKRGRGGSLTGMHVVRKPEQGKDEEIGERAREKRSWFPRGRKHIKPKMGLNGLWVCLMVLSAVSSSVVLCWAPMWRGCDSSIGSVGTASALVLLECVVFMSTSMATIQEGRGFKQCDLSRADSISVHQLLCWEMSVTTIWLGGCCVFSGISLHLGFSVQALACFNVSSLVSQHEREKAGGTKCSSVPKTPRPREVCVVFMGLVLGCGDEEWVVNQSYIVMLSGWWWWWGLVVCPLVSRGTFGPLYESGCVLTEDTWGGGCWVGMLSACICLSLSAHVPVHVCFDLLSSPIN